MTERKRWGDVEADARILRTLPTRFLTQSPISQSSSNWQKWLHYSSNPLQTVIYQIRMLLHNTRPPTWPRPGALRSEEDFSDWTKPTEQGVGICVFTLYALMWIYFNRPQINVKCEVDKNTWAQVFSESFRVRDHNGCDAAGRERQVH